jgi:hypothetical protein
MGLAERHDTGWNDADLIRRVYLLRLPYEYTFAGTTRTAATIFAGKVLLSVVGVLGLRRLEQSPATRALTGLFVGHGFLLIAALLQMAGWGPRIWGESLGPYLLGLSRTTPLFVILGGTLAVVAVERSLERWPVGFPRQRILAVIDNVEARLLSTSTRMTCMAMLLVVVGLALFASRYIRAASGLTYIVPLILGVIAWRRARRGQELTAETTVAFSVAVICLTWIVATHPRAAAVAPEKAGLFAWSGQSTPDTALFIVPPGLLEFRLYARRSVYVDIKLFSPAVPSAGPLWRQRLVQVAAPDAATFEYRGWPGMRDPWDRSYAVHNTPERIAWLLRSTGADFFVRDLAAPVAKQIGPEALASVGLRVAYRNQRYEVDELGSRDDGKQ